MLKHDDNRPGGTYPRPNLFERLRAAFSPSASNSLFRPGSQPSEHMPDLERWTMPHRSMDMADWTVAKNMALNAYRPDRTRLLDLYDSILVDSHLASTMESRVLRVVRSRYRLMKGDKPQPELARMLEAQWFEDFLQYVAEAVFRGHTLIELGELAKPGQLKAVNRIDPRNVLPWSGQVVRQQGQDKGYAFREPPLNAYLIEVGRSDDLGILCDVGPVAIVKKYAVGSWADYVNKFGIPPRWVRTSSRSAHRVKQLEQMMQQMLSSAYGVIEGDEEIQVMTTPGTDAHKVFDELIARMNSEISKRILGQDGTSDNKDASGTYGSLQVLAKVAEDRHMADKASASYIINNELFPRLINLGYPLQGVRFEWDTLQDLGPMELVDAVSKLGMVFDIDPKHVEERTGIKILGARRMPGELGGDGTGSGRQNGGRPPKPTGDDGGEEDEEDGVTASWVGRHLPTCGVCGGGGLITADAVPRVGEVALDAALRDAWDGKQFSPAYFDRITDIYLNALDQRFDPAATITDDDSAAHVARALMDINLFRFSGEKDIAFITDMNIHAKEAKSWSDFKKRVDEAGLDAKYNRDALRAEFTNVAASGIQAERYHQMMGNTDVLPFGEYATVGDTKVRPEHEVLNGKKWPLGDAIWNTIWPPNGWNCRCTVLPAGAGPEGEQAKEQAKWAIGELRRTGAWQRMEQDGFNGNRGISGEVFKLNKAHRDRLVGLRLNPEQAYGTKSMSFDKVTARATHEAPEGMQDQDWFKANQSDGTSEVVMKDWKGRPFFLDQPTVDAHDSETDPQRYGGRGGMLHLAPDILSAPDEVWMKQGDERSVTLYYHKYYKGLPMVVRGELPANALPGQRMKITSWYPVKVTNPKAKEPDTRNGYPIKKMPIQS